LQPSAVKLILDTSPIENAVRLLNQLPASICKRFHGGGDSDPGLVSLDLQGLKQTGTNQLRAIFNAVC